MSEDPTSAEEPDDPLSGLEGFSALGGSPLFGPILGMLQGISPGPASAATSQAREVARTVASGGESEPNVDPSERIAVEQLVRVAELHIAKATGLAPGHGSALRVEVVNRVQWSDRTLQDYSPLFDTIGEAFSKGIAPKADQASDDPMSAMLARITGSLGPMLVSFVAGAMVGRLALQALGGYTLPVPRKPDAPLLVAMPNVDEFRREWSLEEEGLRLWVCLHEAAYHAVFGVEHVRGKLWDLLTRHAAGFDLVAQRLEDRFANLDPFAGPEVVQEIQESLGEPDAILGAVRSPAQEAVLPQLSALVAALTGFVDHTLDAVGAQLIGEHDRLAEAFKRQRLEAGTSDRFVGRLLGLELDAAHYDRGAAFVKGVVERAGAQGLRRLFSHPDNLPTPAEVDAAGLWLARIDLPR